MTDECTVPGRDRILLLATYPCLVPKHGGQFRLSSIVEAYLAEGFAPFTLAVCDPVNHGPEERQASDVIFPDDHPLRLIEGIRLPFTADLQAGKYAVSDEVFSSLIRSLPDEVTVIQLEQPYLLPLARRLREHYRHCAQSFIYSSHNIEAPLKRALLKGAGIESAVVENLTAEIEQLEVAAAREADLVVAVTEEDAAQLRSMGAGQVVLARNGVHANGVRPDLVANWRKQLPESPWMLYVASGYQPNIDGFFEQMGSVLGWLPLDTRVVVVGSAAPAIKQKAESLRWGAINARKLITYNYLSDDDLAAVSCLAHVHLVPMSTGGGSNLKTAAAIRSGKWVVSTTVGMRGYESYMSLSEIHVATSPAEFRKGVLQALESEAIVHPTQPERRNEVLWSHTLQGLMNEVRKLVPHADQHGEAATS